MTKQETKKRRGIWFTSDTHFYHKNVIKYCDRPWENVSDMNEALVQRWNEKIQPQDQIFHLGDFSFGSRKKAIEVLEQLNGKKYLIRGNHDYHCKKEDFAKHWEWIKDFYELKIQDPDAYDGKSQKIVLCHYPLLVWNRHYRSSWMCHGHSHSTLDYMNTDVKRLDVGVDGHNWYPWSYEEIKEHMAHKPIQFLDHHDEETNP